MFKNTGYKEIKQFSTYHLLCNGEYHILGRGGFVDNGVEKHVLADAYGKRKECDCGIHR